jgi:hypothetical protein
VIVWNYGGMAISRGKLKKAMRETCTSYSLSATNITALHPGFNPKLRGEKPASNKSVNVAMLKQAILIQGDSIFNMKEINSSRNVSCFIDQFYIYVSAEYLSSSNDTSFCSNITRLYRDV